MEAPDSQYDSSDQDGTRPKQPSSRLETDGVGDEKIRGLQNVRKGLKASLTRQRHDIRSILARDSPDNVNQLKQKLATLEETYAKFQETHDKHCALLTKEAELQHAMEYHRDVQDAVDDLKAQASSWLTHVADIPEVQPTDSVSQSGSRGSKSSRTSRASKTSSVRQRLAEELATRKALETKMKYLEMEQALAAKKLELQEKREADELQRRRQHEYEDLRMRQEEERLKLEAELQQALARERIFAEADRQSSLYADHQDNAKSERPTSTPARDKRLNPETPAWCPQAPSPSNTSRREEAIEQMVAIQMKQADLIEHMLKQQTQSSLSLTLPKSEMPTFGGDPCEYPNFIRAFESLIEGKTSSESVKLHYLVQYTSGEVKELMRSCLSMEAREGYSEARRLLSKTYGQNYTIATACINKVIQGPPIKADDAQALQKFSVQLMSCRNTLKDIGYINKIENADSLKRVIDRLPYDARKRWRFRAVNISENQDREITLEDITDFIVAEAKVGMHPVFGDISTRNKDNTTPSDSRQKRSSFGIQANSSNIDTRQRGSCLLCSKDHRVEECAALKRKSYEDRVKFVKDKALCFNCLIPHHRAKECRKRPSCITCSRKHATLLHPPTQPTEKEAESTDDTSEGATAKSPVQAKNGFVGIQTEGSCSATVVVQKVALPVIPVVVKSTSRKVITTYAFLDGGSNATFCSKALMDKLDLQGKKTRFSLTTIEKENSDTECEVVNLEVYDLEENVFFELPTVFSRPVLPVSPSDIPTQEDVDRWPHLQGIDIPHIDAQVDLLIGNDNAHVIEPKEVRGSRHGGPYATRTPLGWAVNGPLNHAHSRPKGSANFIRTDTDLARQFENFCNMEFNDTAANVKVELSQEDRKALGTMEETIKMVDGHYQMALPWKEYPPLLPNNKSMAMHRLNLLKRRLAKDQMLFQKYSCSITDLLDKGYAERVPDSARDRSDGMVWYLPHHAVLSPQKPGKVRIVFDCSAKYNNTSLNDHLLPGPDLTNTLVGVLTRFRQERVAMIADIEAMFHQVKVEPGQRDALRFLWWPTGDLDQDPEELRMTVHLFGAVSSPSCCNFALKRSADDNKEDFGPEVSDTVKENFYVDDLLKSTASEKQAIETSHQLCQLLSKGGFHLTKWTSNSKKVVESIPQSERATTVKTLDFGEMPIERALGMQWNVTSDKLGFRITVKDRTPTRRGILSIVSSVYDPLGFAAPFILPAKILLQDLCRLKLGWDEQIPRQHLKRWQGWLEELPKLSEFSADRCLKPPDFGQVMSSQLHHFSDASETGYGAVSYLRLVDSNGNIHCTFVMGKSRVTPLKRITIPRLELSAAVVSVRLDRMSRNELELPVDESIFWTDSTAVLRYLENQDKRFLTFVANRIATIHGGSTPSQWRYVNTKQNPADYASRGLSADALLHTRQWLMGPDFLWKPSKEWPERPAVMNQLPKKDPEVKEDKKSCATIVQRAASVEDILHRFSSWHKLKKFVAWILRFKANLVKVRNDPSTGRSLKRHSHPEPLTVGESICHCYKRGRSGFTSNRTSKQETWSYLWMDQPQEDSGRRALWWRRFRTDTDLSVKCWSGLPQASYAETFVSCVFWRVHRVPEPDMPFGFLWSGQTWYRVPFWVTTLK